MEQLLLPCLRPSLSHSPLPQLLGGELKDLFIVGMTGCGGGGAVDPSKAAGSYAAAPVLAYEAPVVGAPAPLFSGSATGGYMPPDSGDGPLLS